MKWSWKGFLSMAVSLSESGHREPLGNRDARGGLQTTKDSHWYLSDLGFRHLLTGHFPFWPLKRCGNQLRLHLHDSPFPDPASRCLRFQWKIGNRHRASLESGAVCVRSPLDKIFQFLKDKTKSEVQNWLASFCICIYEIIFCITNEISFTIISFSSSDKFRIFWLWNFLQRSSLW